MLHYADLNDSDFNIQILFERFATYDKQKEAKASIEGLKQSMELIGDGEITEKAHYNFYGDRLMYKEYSPDKRKFLIVHGAFTRPTYGGNLGYSYEIRVYSNNPKTVQFGGGYGASGIIETQHPTVFSPRGSDNIYRDETLVSKVCAVVKENFFN